MIYPNKLKNKNILFELLRSKSRNTNEEVCGFILNGEFIERKNIHPNPIDYFLISPKDCIWDENVILFHSHPDHVKEKNFSSWDLENQYFFNMDMLLYSVNNDEFYFKEK